MYSVLVLVLTLCCPFLFVLLEVGPNLSSFGDTTIEPLCCVADPFLGLEITVPLSLFARS